MQCLRARLLQPGSTLLALYSRPVRALARWDTTPFYLIKVKHAIMKLFFLKYHVGCIIFWAWKTKNKHINAMSSSLNARNYLLSLLVYLVWNSLSRVHFYIYLICLSSYSLILIKKVFIFWNEWKKKKVCILLVPIFFSLYECTYFISLTKTRSI
jgi:hypothetical protein